MKFESEAHEYYYRHALRGRYVIYKINSSLINSRSRFENDGSSGWIITDNPAAKCNSFLLAAKWLAKNGKPYTKYIVISPRMAGGNIVDDYELEDKICEWQAALSYGKQSRA
jgi:hypothetical protein